MSERGSAWSGAGGCGAVTAPEDEEPYEEPNLCGHPGCEPDWCEEDGPDDLPDVISRKE